eukprot:scaffold15710_cov134-Isochrysis_galbana.AAC.3
MSISSYASDLSAASPSHSCEFTQSHPSPSSGMVQPVVNEMFATVHAAGSSLLGLFTSCATFDSTYTYLPKSSDGDGFVIAAPFDSVIFSEGFRECGMRKSGLCHMEKPSTPSRVDRCQGQG